MKKRSPSARRFRFTLLPSWQCLPPLCLRLTWAVRNATCLNTTYCSTRADTRFRRECACFSTPQVSAIWAASSILVQLITDDLDFDRPFAITYIGSSLFVGYIPSYAMMSSFGWIRRAPLREPGGELDCVLGAHNVYSASARTKPAENRFNLKLGAMISYPTWWVLHVCSRTQISSMGLSGGCCRFLQLCFDALLGERDPTMVRRIRCDVHWLDVAHSIGLGVLSSFISSQSRRFMCATEPVCLYIFLYRLNIGRGLDSGDAPEITLKCTGTNDVHDTGVRRVPFCLAFILARKTLSH